VLNLKSLSAHCTPTPPTRLLATAHYLSLQDVKVYAHSWFFWTQSKKRIFYRKPFN